jgi:hypothetical protein
VVDENLGSANVERASLVVMQCEPLHIRYDTILMIGVHERRFPFDQSRKTQI